MIGRDRLSGIVMSSFALKLSLICNCFKKGGIVEELARMGWSVETSWRFFFILEILRLGGGDELSLCR